MFEAAGHIGGRSTTVDVYSNSSEPVELGASVFVDANRNLVAAAKELGLKVSGVKVRSKNRGDDHADDGLPDGLGVWNGEEFVYRQSDDSSYWWTILRLLWKYGLSPVRTNSLMKSTVATFLKMYEPPYFPFRSLSDTAHELGLTGMTSSTGEQALESHGIGRLFATDIVQASTRVNYAQNLKLIHGLETMVCMAAGGAMSVTGGNWQIFAGMIKSADAAVRLNTSVYAIERRRRRRGHAARGFTVRSRTKGPGDHGTKEAADEHEDSFDAVVLAAPFQFANISISPPLDGGDGGRRGKAPDAIPYVSQHVTLFASPHKLSPSFFNLPAGSSVPRVVLTTLGKNDDPGSSQDGVGSAGFLSISMLRVVQNYGWLRTHDARPGDEDGHDEDEAAGRARTAADRPRREYLYKIFSPKPVTESFLRSLLGLTGQGCPSSPSVEHQEAAAAHMDALAGPLPSTIGAVTMADNPRTTASSSSSSSSSYNPSTPFPNISPQDVSWVHTHVWPHAYPYLYPRVTFEDSAIVLGGGGDGDDDEGAGLLYYTSGIEAFISTMETSSLMGMNVARILVDDLTSAGASSSGSYGTFDSSDSSGPSSSSSSSS